MSLWLWFLLAALSVERLARMVATEEGPFGVFERFRDQFTKENWIGRGVRCSQCMGFWISALIALLLVLLAIFPVPAYPLLWWGLAGAASAIERWWKR